MIHGMAANSTSPEIIILGAGVIGSSVAYHLATRGARVRVLERHDRPITGFDAPSSTARATGGFRVQYGTKINTQLSLIGRDMLLEFENLTGVNPGYRQCGYIFMASSEAHLHELRTSLEVQRSAGLTVSHAVSLSEIANLNPALNLEGVLGGTFCPWDGFIRPLEILRGFREAAERAGAVFEYGVDGRLEIQGARVTGVRTQTGVISSDVVVNATGAWAGELMRQAGLELEVQPSRRQVASSMPTDVLPEDMPMSIFVDDGFHLRVRDGRVILLKPALPQFTQAAHENPFSLEFDPSWLPDVLGSAHARVPVLRDVPIDPERCWTGLYEMSPDTHAILGRAPKLENLYLANGSSGHGTMHSPALGKLLSEMILDGQTSSLDAHALRPERFAENDPVRGSNLV
jgi:sarcosine oxidase, subunit beta